MGPSWVAALQAGEEGQHPPSSTEQVHDALSNQALVHHPVKLLYMIQSGPCAPFGEALVHHPVKPL